MSASQGNRMRGTLFGDQIEAFDEALQYLGEYDISAAPIKFIDEKWRTELDQFPYQMTFGSRTVIQPVHPELGPILPNYRPIASIPRAVDPDERYGKYFDKLPTWEEAFKVIGFTALKPYTRRGFLMNSAMSTRIIYEPEGERARVVSDWANLFHQRLVDRQARVLDVRYPSENKKNVFAELKQKKPSNTLQEETLWIEVTIQDAELEKVNAYTGCSNCCKRTNLPLITFKFEASDTTETMAFTTFNDDTERLFRKTAAEIYAIKESDDHNAFKAIQDLLSSTPFYIKVGPTWHLGQNNVLEWTLRAIELKENPHTHEAEQLSAGYFSQEKDASEKVPENTIESGNSEPFIPTPNLKKNFDKHTQEEPYPETLDTPQQSIESLKRKKSLGKSPMEFESQNPTIPLAKDRVEDVAEPLGSEHRQTTPIIVKLKRLTSHLLNLPPRKSSP
uniref:Uncharacterized protein n=1 Tax=Chenopodium quinoa TaxID=63459 RepID=A0A803LLL1_CHEQI